jgi:hypothetical protein
MNPRISQPSPQRLPGAGRGPRVNKCWNRAHLVRVLAITDGGTPSREGGFPVPGA